MDRTDSLMDTAAGKGRLSARYHEQEMLEIFIAGAPQ